MEKYKIRKSAIISLLIAPFIWFVIFVIKPFNFWIEMSLAVSFLSAIALFSDRSLLAIKKITIRHVIIGIVSAILLYFVFYLGNIITGYLLPFKDSQVISVYNNRAQGSSLVIGLLLLAIIGPGEEIYWRGFIQNMFSKKFGENNGYIYATLLYTAVHVITLNFMLIIAALVCGIFWGWIYKKEKSLAPVIISHAIWDVTIFVLFPLM